MNNTIIFHFQPFTFQQTINYYGEDDYNEILYITNDQIVDSIKGLINKYEDIKVVDLYGNEDYLAKIKSEILTDFEEHKNIEINLKGENYG